MRSDAGAMGKEWVSWNSAPNFHALVASVIERQPLRADKRKDNRNPTIDEM